MAPLRNRNIDQLIEKTGKILVLLGLSLGILISATQAFSAETLSASGADLNAFFSKAPSASGSAKDLDLDLDHDTLVYFLNSAAPLDSEKLEPVTDRIERLHLRRVGEHYDITLSFSEAFDFAIRDAEDTPSWEVDSVHFPQTIRIPIEAHDGLLTAHELDKASDNLVLGMKLPVGSADVYLRTVTVDITSGNFDVYAGVMRDTVGISASGNFIARKIDGINLLQTIALNLFQEMRFLRFLVPWV